MDQNQFRQIVKEEVNDALEPVKKDLNELKRVVKEIEENVDAARGDIEQLHMDVKGIREKEGLFHSRNKREIDEIKTHLGMSLMPDTP